jgi:hypothetical protein
MPFQLMSALQHQTSRPSDGDCRKGNAQALAKAIAGHAAAD